MGFKFKLDFNIWSAKDRLEAIRSIDLEKLNPTELETISNYILYGKDEDGTSIVDRKQVQIKTRFDSYKKNREVSLEELIETPTFDESILQKNRTVYKNPRASIDKERAVKIPGMVELWKDIDRFDLILKQNQGKVPKDKNTPELTQRELYFLNHYLIELRTQQYYLWDSYYPTMGKSQNKAEFKPYPTDSHLSFKIFPRGLMRFEKDDWFTQPYLQPKEFDLWELGTDEEIEDLRRRHKRYIDFRDENHLYYLIQFYTDLQDFVKDYPDSIIHNLLWTLDFYIGKAKLSEQQEFIVNCKKCRFSNKEIAWALERELGISHQENYISTIWTKAVKLIQEAVELNFDEFICRNYEKAWKKCNRCGKILLRDKRNFVKKDNSADGMTNRCKMCDKCLRLGVDPLSEDPVKAIRELKKFDGNSNHYY